MARLVLLTILLAGLAVADPADQCGTDPQSRLRNHMDEAAIARLQRLAEFLGKRI